MRVRKRGGNWSSTNCWNRSQLSCSFRGRLIPLERHHSLISHSSQSCPRAQTGRTVPWTRDSLTFNKIKAALTPVKAEAKKIFRQQPGSLSTAWFLGARQPFQRSLGGSVIIMIKAQLSLSDGLWDSLIQPSTFHLVLQSFSAGAPQTP